MMTAKIRSTTILAVLRGGRLAVGGDGQVSLGQSILKSGAVKVRSLASGKVLAGFAGSTADALTLFDKFDSQLEAHSNNLKRAAVELAKEWRTDRVLRRLEALLIVGNEEILLTISGNGDVIEPDDGLAAIGSGGMYALAAARALVNNTTLGPREVVEKALLVASEICVYTNAHFEIRELP